MLSSDADPKDTWPGHASVNRAGVELAVEMLDSLESTATPDNGSYITEADYSSLEDWPRHGHPFRNIMLEYLERARAAGPDVEAGFCALLSDYVSLCCAGSVPEVDNYADMFGID